MKKLNILLVSFLLTLPGIALSADNAPPPQALEAAAYQQGEAVDTSPPVAAAQATAAAPAAASVPAPAPVPAQTKAEAEETSAPAPAAAKNPAVEMSASEQLAVLQSDVDTLQERADTMDNRLNQLQYGTAILAAMILLLAFLLLKRRKKSAVKSVPATHTGGADKKTIKIEDDTRGEYDFMGSSEGIPAKLDLARAYIAMEDYTSARETLSEILGEGNEAQRQEARILLGKIKD